MTRALLFLFVLFGNSNAAMATGTADISALLQQAQTKALADHPYWKALLHYRATASDPSTLYISDINSPEFFLAATGRTDSSSELAATLQAFFALPEGDQNRHAQCRFVARYRWLQQSLDWGSLHPPGVNCEGFAAWSRNGNIKSLSLIFATGYLSNPASLYGHILLKFNTQSTDIPVDLLDESINFGAIVPQNEFGIVYIAKGLFGGYDALFSHERFYRFNHNYAENELRDLWEYEIEFSDDEVNQIVAHAWELLGNRFTYYFFKENCAYRMAELLELVVQRPLLPPSLPWSVPATVFDRLASSQRNGMPLVRAVRRIPSRQNRYYDNFSALTLTQKSVAEDIVSNKLNFTNPFFQRLPNTEKIQIIDTLFDYYEFRIATEDDDRQFKQAKQKLLVERAALPIQLSTDTENSIIETNAAPPHHGPKPGMIRLGIFNNSALGAGVEIRLRPAYYDLLSPDIGHVADSSLAMLDLRAFVVDNQLHLRSLDLVNIETLNVARTPLPGDGGLAWKIKFGFETQSSGCSNCLAFNITGGIGKATRLSHQTIVFSMLELFAQSNANAAGLFGATARAGLLIAPNKNWKTLITVGQRTNFNGAKLSHPLIRWENRFGSSRDWDLRLTYEDLVERELQVAISFYW